MGVIQGVDYANPRPSAAALRAAGKQFVIRYLSPNTTNNPRKTITGAEITDFRNNGLDIGLVWESTTSRATQGAAAGTSDARAAEKVRKALGIPVTGIFFAVDEDTSGASVADYFHGVVNEIGLARTGAYAGIKVIKYLFDHSLIHYGWQTYAWSGGEWDARAQVQQYHNGQTVAGADVDLCRAMVPEWGQWHAANPPSVPPPVEDELSAEDVQTILAAIAKIDDAVSHTAEFDPNAAGQYQHSLSAVIDGLQNDLAEVKAQSASNGGQLSTLSSKVDALAAAVKAMGMPTVTGITFGSTVKLTEPEA